MAEDNKNAKKLSLSDIRDEAVKINQIVAAWKAGSEDMDALLTLVRAQGSLLVEACDRTTDIEKGLLLANRRLTATVDALTEQVAALEASGGGNGAPTTESQAPTGGDGDAAEASPVQAGPPQMPPSDGNIVKSVTIKP